VHELGRDGSRDRGSIPLEGRGGGRITQVCLGYLLTVDNRCFILAKNHKNPEIVGLDRFLWRAYTTPPLRGLTTGQSIKKVGIETTVSLPTSIHRCPNLLDHKPRLPTTPPAPAPSLIYTDHLLAPSLPPSRTTFPHTSSPFFTESHPGLS
jgi:hypothetical protein